ncbi:MAG: HD family phosphohydrolase, partial [Desulfosalsimonadaceae bacterium]
MSVTLISTLILSPRLVVTGSSYSLGDIANKNIKAPSDFFVEDAQATAQQKKAAREGVLTVYDYDDDLSGNLKNQVKKAFSLPRTLFESASGEKS